MARRVEAAARTRGVLVNAAQPDVVRLAPPLVLSPDEAALAVSVIAQSLAECLGDSTDADTPGSGERASARP